ncbi:MAG: hypothetical protein ABJF10_18945 [Chthoniobacter sp.]|uniref:hypothetical protein n=1 Tax=Chthoniobacter sp. TaxID=2510640 RepID=UPI0032A509D8
MSRKPILTVVCCIILGIYLAGYAFLRVEIQIVHRSSVAGGNYYSHSVEVSDGIMASATINDLIALAYTPLRYVEIGYWRLRQPLDSPLSEGERRRRAE